MNIIKYSFVYFLFLINIFLGCSNEREKCLKSEDSYDANIVCNGALLSLVMAKGSASQIMYEFATVTCINKELVRAGCHEKSKYIPAN